jgi:hypothetical protein
VLNLTNPVLVARCASSVQAADTGRTLGLSIGEQRPSGFVAEVLRREVGEDMTVLG